jgi:acetamidase/formamidase
MMTAVAAMVSCCWTAAAGSDAAIRMVHACRSAIETAAAAAGGDGDDGGGFAVNASMDATMTMRLSERLQLQAPAKQRMTETIISAAAEAAVVVAAIVAAVADAAAKSQCENVATGSVRLRPHEQVRVKVLMRSVAAADVVAVVDQQQYRHWRRVVACVCATAAVAAVP